MFFCGLLCLAAPVPPDPAKSELDHWQGEWRVVQMEITTGKRTARLKFTEKEQAAWTIKNDQLEISGLMFAFTKAKLVLDAKHVKLTLTDGALKGQLVEGEFVRDGNTLNLEFTAWPKDNEQTVSLRLSLQHQRE